MEHHHGKQVSPASANVSADKAFVDRSKFVLTEMRSGEVQDEEFMCFWSWERLKNWTPNSGKLKKIHESKNGSEC